MSDEVLVHISTPATRQNDELFRTVANAYTRFEPYRTHRDIGARKIPRGDITKPWRSKKSSTRAGISPTDETAFLSSLITSKGSYGSFPSSLSTGERCMGQDESVRSTSRLAQLDQNYLSWRKRATPKASFRRNREDLKTDSDSVDADTGFIEDSQSALQAVQSQLQDIYSTTSADTSDDGNDANDNSLHAESQPPPTPNPSTSHRNRTAEEAPPPALSHTHVGVKHGSEISWRPDAVMAYIPHTSQSDQIPSDIGETVFQESTKISNQAILAAGDDPNAASHFSQLPIDAFPPAPPVTIAHPGTLPSQITKHLAAVKIKHPSRFRPLRTRRELENDERGFWRIDCIQWPANAQREFWLSLCEHVCSGRIGWGITLHRQHESRHRLGLVQLYCWGELVEHTWLLLWLCSEGRISGLRLKWIDANGVAVIETE